MTTSTAAHAHVERLEAQVATLAEGLVTRTLIGQATGLLAGRFDLPIDTAWHALSNVSNLTNRKVREVAQVLVQAHDGTLPVADRELGRQIADALQEALTRAAHQ